jgi:hypothetical protein
MLTRRRLLAATAALPILAAVQRGLEGLRSAAATVRPPGSGTSATRCAQCGAADHAMLDPRCPSAPRVLG